MIESEVILIKLAITSLIMYLVVKFECYLERNVITEDRGTRFDILFLSTITAVDILGIYFIVQFVTLVRPFFTNTY
jgi:hypothetical protein